MQFVGEFDPPALGVKRVPIPVAGPGTLTATEEGVVVEGHRSRSTAPGIMLWMLSVLVGVVAGGALFPDSRILAKSFGYMVAIAGAGAAFGRRKAGKKAVRYAYSWHQLGNTSLTRDGSSIVVDIAGAGTLHFRPSMDPTKVLEHLEDGPAIDFERTPLSDPWNELEPTPKEAPRYRS
ncbi:MAG: hypothetical protein ABI321_24925 [Polyangia bacterium]